MKNNQGSTITTFQLPSSDPEAGLILDSDSQLLGQNQAAKDLCAETGTDNPIRLLPINFSALINACLTQGRAIEGVESRQHSATLSWTFIPDQDSRQVLARGRDVTDNIRKLDEATRSSRLYRLITENTTDLISRHAPDGRFIDATPNELKLSTV